MIRTPAAIPVFILMALALSTTLRADVETHGDADSGATPLITQMLRMQYYAHKLGLAVQAENRDLQAFYAHELEEVIEAVAEIERYEDVAVSELIATTLEPAFAELEAALDGGRPSTISTKYDALLDSCNSCHENAERAFIVIQRNDHNPYAQAFSPPPER
mgnify:CR=1 FL=1